MVKYSTLVIGFILFSLFITLMFTAASLIGSDYGSQDAGNYSELAATYDDYITEESTEENSTFRKIQSKLESSNSVISVGSDILTAAIEGVKLFGRTLITGGKVTDQLTEEMSGRVHPLFGIAIKSILAITLIIIVISMLMRSKAET